MKKYKNAIIIVGVIVLVFVLSFVVSNITNKSYVEEVTYDEYKEIVSSNSDFSVYVGDITLVKSTLNKLGKEEEKTIYYIDPSLLSDEQKEEIGYENDVILNYKDGEVEDKNDIYLQEVTVDEYLKIIKEGGYHFMFIGSTSCGYCTMFKEEISKVQLLHDVNFYYLDLYNTEQDDLEKLYNSDSYFTTEEWGTPLNFLYKDGKKINVLSGYVEAETLIEFLEENGVINE